MHDGHRERLKNRFLKDGIDNFEKHNMLELLLFYSIPRRDTNEIAHTLIDSFGSLSGVFNAPFEELCKIDGIGENSATLIKLIPALCKQYVCDLSQEKIVIDCVKTAVDYAVKRFLGDTNEKLIMMCLDSGCRLINTEIIEQGSVTYVNANMRRMVEIAVKNGAVSVILSHNHPSGNVVPSGDDAIVTVMARDALKVIDIKLVDHIICATDGVSAFSMASDKNFKKYFSK